MAFCHQYAEQNLPHISWWMRNSCLRCLGEHRDIQWGTQGCQNVSGTWGTDIFRETGHNLSLHLLMQLPPSGSKAMDSAPRPMQVFSYPHNLSPIALTDLAGMQQHGAVISPSSWASCASHTAVAAGSRPGSITNTTVMWFFLSIGAFLIPAPLHPLFVPGPTITRVIHSIMLLQEVRSDCCTEISHTVADAGGSNAKGK